MRAPITRVASHGSVRAVLLALLSLCVLSGPGCAWIESVDWRHPETWFRGPEGPAPDGPKAVQETVSPEAEAAEHFAELLQAARRKVEEANDFHCVLTRREVVGGKLKPEEQLDYTQRFEPHSLKLEWVGEVHKGRRLIYVKGANDDKVIVRVGNEGGLMGLVGRLKKEWRLDLDDPQIRSNSRYPPDAGGYNRLVRRMTEDYGEALTLSMAWVTASPPEETDGRRLRRFEVTLEHVLLDTDTSRMIVWFDLDKLLPVHTVRWDARGRRVEDYDWRDAELNIGLTDADFTFEKP